MDRRIYPPLLLLFLLSLCSPLLAQLPTGTEFMVPLPSIMTFNERNDTSITFTVEVMCSRETIVSVRWANVPANNPLGYLVNQTTVQAGTRLVVKRPMFQLFQIAQSDHRDSALLPNSRVFVVTSNHPVTVQATYDKKYLSETYMVPPTSSFDLDYTVLTYNGYGQGAANGRTGYIVMAREDNTVLQIDPSADVLWGMIRGIPYTITLNRHQVYQALAATGNGGRLSDMSGTKIRSNKPVGVIAFGSSNVPSFEPAGQPPADQYYWGKTFVDPQLSDSMGGTLLYTAPFVRAASYARFITMAPNVSVDVNGVPFGTYPNRGTIFDLRITGSTKIESTGKMIGAQFATSNNLQGFDTTIVRKDLPDTTVRIPYGDPMMAYLPPVTQFKTAVQWATPNMPERPYMRGASPLVFYWRHYALVTAPVSAAASVRIDGLPVNFTMTHSDGEYVSAIVAIPPRQHVVEAEEPISVLAYGFTWNDSYGMAAGEALRSAAIPSLDSIGLLSCEEEFDTTFVIRNRGNNAFRIDSIAASGIEIRTLVPASFPYEVGPGDSAFITVVVRMTQAGSYQGTLRLYTDANNQRTFEIPVRAERDSAQLEYLPTVDFARLKASETTRDTTIIIRNTGSREVTITSIGFDRPGYRLISPTPPLVIPAGGIDSIRVRFAPTDDGSYESTLRLTGTPCMAQQTITLLGYKGSGASLLLRRSIEYPSYDCEQIAPAFVDSLVVIRNIGDEPAEVLTGVIDGTHATEFALLDAAEGLMILPGDSVVLRVRYTPGGYGARTAQLTITTSASNAQSVAIALRARRDTAAVSPSLRVIDFGSVLSCGGGIDTVVSLQNSGTVYDTLEVISSDAAFSVGTTERIILPPGRDIELPVRFMPTGDGEFSGRVVITGSPCGLREEIEVRGRRVAPQLTASPSLLRFERLYSCEAARTAEIVLRNEGEVSDTIFGGSIAGSGLFTLEMGGDTIILGPGEETTVVVRFTPEAGTGAGTFLGAANIAWGPCAGSSTVDLTAEIIDPIVQLSSESVAIGDVDLLASGRGSVVLTNESTVDREVTGIDITPTGSFRVVSPTSFPVVIPAGGTLEVEFEYEAEQAGEAAAVAHVEIAGPCPEQKEIALTARGVGEPVIAVTIGLGVPSLSGFIDDRIEVPVSITRSTNLALAEGRTARFWVSYGTRLLAPLGVTTMIPGMTARIVRDSIAGSRRWSLVELSGGVLPSEGEIARVELLVLLGDETTTALEVTLAELLFAQGAGLLSVVDPSTNGVFTSLGYCETGGERFVRRGGSLKLSSARPNPFKGETEVEVELGARRQVELRVIDGRGIEVARLLDGTLEAGTHRVVFAAGELASGLYVCELRSQGEVRREILILLK